MRACTLLLSVLVVLNSSALAQEISLTVAEPSGVQRTGFPVPSGVPLARENSAGTVRRPSLMPTARSFPCRARFSRVGPMGAFAGCFWIFKST